MKKMFLPHFKKSLSLLIPLLFLFGCQQDEIDQSKRDLSIQQTSRSVNRIVAVSEIPEVVDFLRSKSNENLEFVISSLESNDPMSRNHEDNLIMTSVLTDQITQATNNFGKSSYTFKLIEQEDKEGIYFLNLVVKEFKDTMYMYIVNYVPDHEWLNSLDGRMDLATFSGTLYFYNDSGYYLAKAIMNQGDSVDIQSRDCPNPDDDNDNPWDSDDWGDNGEGGNGGGGSGCTIIISFGSSSGAGCSACEGDLIGDHDHDISEGDTWVNVEYVCSGDQRRAGSELFTREPCPGGSNGGASGSNTDCSNSGNDCVFPMAYDTNCNCVEAEQIENDDVAVTPESKLVMLLNSILSPDLTPQQIAWMEDDAVNKIFARSIYDHFVSIYGLNNELSMEDNALAQKVLDILMGFSDTSSLSTLHEHRTFAKIMGRGLTKSQPSLFEEYQEAYYDIDPYDILNISDWVLVNAKILENHLLTRSYPVASLFFDADLPADIRDQVARNDSFIVMLAHVKSLVGEHWPQNPEEYAAIGTIMGQFLVEIGLAVIPGSGIIDAFEAAEQNDYLAVTFALATVIADFFGGAIIKVIAKIGKVGYKTFKIFKSIYRYLANVVSGIADEIIETVLDDDVVRILSLAGDELAKVVDDIMEISHHAIRAVDNSVIFRSADDVNAGFILNGEVGPYKVGTVVTKFTTSNAEQFVRVYYDGGPSGPVGRWIVKQSDIAGLSPEQVKDVLALPGAYPPNKIVNVNLPAGTSLNLGITAPNFGGTGGVTQIQILSEINSNWYGVPTNL